LLVTNDDFSQFQMFALDGGHPQPLPQLQKGDRPLDFTLDDTALLVRRTNAQSAAEIWRVELPGSKRTLLRTIPLPEVPSITNGLFVAVSRDGKNFAYSYSRFMSTEYVVEGLH
jgi:hypothetical protein